MAGIGVDGCRGGWMYFCLDTSGATFGVVRTLSELLQRTDAGDVVLVDVPIGLRDEGPLERLCDLEARAVLAPARRGSSVFPVPCREAAHAETYEEASRINQARTGRRLSRQTWGIVPGIREADLLIRNDARARERMREAHPEVLFWALAGGTLVAESKKTREGFLARMDLLSAAWPGAEEVAAAAFVQHGGFRVSRDDVVDALAAAVSALGAGGLQTLPGDPELDALGIPMEMVYAGPRLTP